MNGFFDWLFDPVADMVKDFKNSHSNDIDNLDLPTEKREMEFAPAPKTKIFRPQIFEEYIGQEKAKNKLISYINAMQKREATMPHILIHGKAGCGKTTLARIIANELQVKFKEQITSNADIAYIDSDIEEVEGGILFRDEIHAMPREDAEQIYTIMEDFTHNGEPIEQFTLIGATTELGEIIKSRRPFFDRFKIKIKLEDYTNEDISEIVKQYKMNTFPNDTINENIYTIIGKNSRSTPRIAISLLEATIYLEGNIQQVLENDNIIKDGYTDEDLKILEYIAKNEKGVGLQGLVSYLDTSSENYNYQIEPYLLKNGLVIRTPRGRKITQEGIDKIKELKNV